MVWGPGVQLEGERDNRGLRSRPAPQGLGRSSGNLQHMWFASGAWRLPPSAEAQQLSAPLNSLCSGSWANEGGCPQSCRLSPLDQTPETAGQPQAASCRPRMGEAGLLRAAQSCSGSLGRPNPETSWPTVAKANSEHMSPAQPLWKCLSLRQGLVPSGTLSSTSLSSSFTASSLPPLERVSSEFDTPL